MSTEEKKYYDHLSNEDLIKLLSKCRLMNFENFPEEFKDIDVPHGHDLLEVLIQRLKDSDEYEEALSGVGLDPVRQLSRKVTL